MNPLAEKPDIVLVSPATRAYSPVVPFPVIYLASFLKKRGLRCRVIDIKSRDFKVDLQQTEKTILREILDINPPHVGFTCLSAEYLSVSRMARQLREQGYKGKIIAGGHHPTFYPQDFIYANSPFDYVVLGEGEETLAELLEGLAGCRGIPQIPGLAFYDGNFIVTSKRPVIEDLSILPMPAYEQLDMDFYLQPRTSIIRYGIFVGVDVQTTRGCPCQCTYCGNPTLWSVHSYKARFRCRPIAHVLEELEFLHDRYKIDSFFINDDSFTVSEARVDEFCDGLQKRHLSSLVWGMQTRVNMFTEKMAKAVVGAGCRQVEFGVESGSARILKLMKKGITLDQVRRAYAICRRYKLRTFANFMINTPTETEQDLKATIRLAKELKATQYGFFVTVPLPGTEIYRDYVHPPLSKEEYAVYLGSQPYKQVVDPRFKLAEHNKNISLLAMFLYLRFTAGRLYLDPLITFFRYRKFYRKSAYRRQYNKAFWNIFVYRILKNLNSFFDVLRGLRNRFFLLKNDF